MSTSLKMLEALDELMSDKALFGWLAMGSQLAKAFEGSESLRDTYPIAAASAINASHT